MLGTLDWWECSATDTSLLCLYCYDLASSLDYGFVFGLATCIVFLGLGNGSCTAGLTQSCNKGLQLVDIPCNLL